MADRSLQVVMYHYVRDLPRTAFPRIKGMLSEDFRVQVDRLASEFEMASLDSALDFLEGRYEPKRDLCLLSFDDGLKDHFETVTPVLAERHIQGVFFLVTSCVEEHRVASVHKNHFLMASLEFDEYRSAFLHAAGDGAAVAAVDTAIAQRTYPWDTREVAVFKYFFNFLLNAEVRDRAVDTLFERYLGREDAFARQLYLSWDEAKQMQRAGMSIGGHTHEHRPLAALDHAALGRDLAACRNLLEQNLLPQRSWPFSYPYGKKDSFTEDAVRRVRALGFACSFSTEQGANRPGDDLFAIRRIDCKVAVPKGVA